MKHLFTVRVRAVLVAAVLIAIVLAVVGSLIGLSFPQTVVQGVLSPFRAGASKLMDGAEQLYDYIFKYESLQAENDALKEQLHVLRQQGRRRGDGQRVMRATSVAGDLHGAVAAADGVAV